MNQISKYIFSDDGHDDLGYWSNLSEENNRILMSAIEVKPAKTVITENFPELYDIIFSDKRAAALELLSLTGNETCIDFGCMWGALTIPLAKQCSSVLGVDQTIQSLKLTERRLIDDGLENVTLVNANLKTFVPNISTYDIAVVNGVLEWIPEEGHIDLKSYYGKFNSKSYSSGISPRLHHIQFLKNVRNCLTAKGRLLLAIENRYDYRLFLGLKDPHVNIPFVTFLPRSFANFLSKIQLGRQYINWIYGENDMIKLLKDSGFSSVQLYFSFPNYHEPEQIFSSQDRDSLRMYRNSASRRTKKSIRSRLVSLLNLLFFRYLRFGYFAPAFIVIADK